MRLPLPLLLLCGASCSFTPRAPVLTSPPAVPPRSAMVQAGLLAVVDWTDQRPDYERGDGAVSGIRSRESEPRRFYWHFDPDGPSFRPESEFAGHHVKITGDGAFAWYSFPFTGTLGAEKQSLAEGLTDYVGLALAQRGAVSEVVRVDDRAQARTLQADWVLLGEIRHFACLFRERPVDPDRASDDHQKFQLASRVELHLSLEDAAGAVLFEETFSHSADPEDLHLFDDLDLRRDSMVLPITLVDAADTPQYAFSDMVAHLQRELARQTLAVTAALEQSLAGEDG